MRRSPSGTSCGSDTSGRLRALGALGIVGAVAISISLGRADRPAVAQTTPPSTGQVSLTLVSESAWTSQNHPLDVSVMATNRSQTELQNLSVVLSIGSPTRSRSAYELSIHTDATSTIFALSFVQQGAIGPGVSRQFHIRQPTTAVPGLGDNGLYPLKLVLLSGDAPVATLRTPMIYLIEHPKVPLNLSWTWTVAAPVQAGPDGVFLPGPLEREIAPGGRLDALGRALTSTGNQPIDLVVSPVLLGELQRMAPGYRIRDAAGHVRQVPVGTGGAADASRLLDELRTAAGRPRTELVALPFGDASIPTLIRSGLGAELPELLARGRSAVQTALRAPTAFTVSRPMLSQLDAPTIAALADQGSTVALVDPNFLPTAPGLVHSPVPVARLTGGGASLSAVLPDAGAASVAATTAPQDPRLAAQAMLGELAADWLELPGTPNRGAAVLFAERSTLHPAFYPAFAALVHSSPWLAAQSASTFVGLVPPERRQDVPARDYPAFPAEYIQALDRGRSTLEQFRRAVPEATALAERLQGDLFLAEGQTFLGNQALGLRFVAAVAGAVRATYRQIGIAPTPVTLTSRSGVIPVTVGNQSAYAIDAEIRLIADRRVSFVDGSTRSVSLPHGVQVFQFHVRAQTTGRFPIKVQLRTSASPIAQTIAEREIVVRSTAYNRVALLLTIGAAVFLFAWWGRRFLPRRKP